MRVTFDVPLQEKYPSETSKGFGEPGGQNTEEEPQGAGTLGPSQ